MAIMREQKNQIKSENIVMELLFILRHRVISMPLFIDFFIELCYNIIIKIKGGRI